MRAFLMPNLQKEQALRFAAQLGEALLTQGGEVLVNQRDRSLLPLERAKYASFEQCASSCDLIIAVGGDGTIIHAAKHAVQEGKMVLGINAGHLGFLAQAEQNELEPLIRRLLAGDYKVENRFVLRASIRGGSRSYSDYAINDAVISKGYACNLANLEFDCDGIYMDRFRADGVIFATPTGSTAYSMSAGGPIVDPALDAILMTPVCPHRLTARALLFAANKTVSVRPQADSPPDQLYLSLDGAEPMPLCPDEYVEICKAEQVARFISFGNKEFFEIVTQKIVQRG